MRKQRIAYDAYGTPGWTIHRLLESSIQLPSGLWIEPSAGDGNVIRAVNQKRGPVTWYAVELQRQYEASLLASGVSPGCLHVGSFIQKAKDFRFQRSGVSVVLGNPPYFRALEFVQAGLKVAPHVVYLMRLGFLASDTRADWMQRHTPHIRSGTANACCPAFARQSSVQRPELVS